ncbi:MAG: DUF1501 domain-containing protein, partial [Planctomycetaceae bacterium]|nr:DUF1501 domain-containing protein [Planctomycetaceae bacterium]
MNANSKHAELVTRRHFLRDCQMGLGGMALASLSAQGAAAAPSDSVVNPLAPRQPHFEPKAKNVIFLHMAGSPPHLDLLDYKPELVKRNDQPCPDEFIKGKRFAFTSGTPKLLGSPHKFAQHGKSGTWVSDALPHISGVVDDIAVIRSMNTEQFNHAPAQLMLYTGSQRMGRPAIGAWATYGLGSENKNLPGYVVLRSTVAPRADEHMARPDDLLDEFPEAPASAVVTELEDVEPPTSHEEDVARYVAALHGAHPAGSIAVLVRTNVMGARLLHEFRRTVGDRQPLPVSGEG